jgi:hypothetical protein
MGTIYAGHILMQTVTEHLHPPYVGEPGSIITPPPGPWDEGLVEIYPRRPKNVDWPTKPFPGEGSTGILALRDRWHMGERRTGLRTCDSDQLIGQLFVMSAERWRFNRHSIAFTLLCIGGDFARCIVSISS